MPVSIEAHAADILHLDDGHLEAARARWGRLTPVDLACIRTVADLARRVEERYGSEPAQALEEVELWAKDRRFAHWAF